MKLSNPLSPQRDSVEIEECAAAFDGTDQIRLRFNEQARYSDTALMTLQLSLKDWQVLVRTVDEAVAGASDLRGP